ncbi:hypothetical protein F4778DRAFT_365725 [Xylariomycetidae sp. FL2044]|nr:hypothetical protein F4778DRAFT_365725 [Xylariomycetidae sp. FL2044]
MFTLFVAAVLLGTLLPISLCSPQADAASAILPTLIHEFPNGTWAENLAVRSNGQLVTTFGTAPDLYQVDPQNRCPPFLLHRFSGFAGGMGIVETSPDIFQVVMGNFSLATFAGEVGTFVVFQVDLRATSICPGSSGAPASRVPVSQTANVAGAKFLNGLTTLPYLDHVILGADMNLGVIWRIDISSGKSSIGFQDPLLDLAENTMFGPDGVKIRADELFFTNPGKLIIGKIPIDASGYATGPASIVAPVGGDDFTFDHAEQNIFSVGVTDTVTEVFTDEGRAVNVTDLAGPTACQFGRTKRDQGCLYVTTCGGYTAYSQSPVEVAGGVYSVDVFRNGSCV